MKTSIAARTLRVIVLSKGFGAMLGIVSANIVIIGVGFGDPVLSLGIISGSVMTWGAVEIAEYRLNAGGIDD